MKILAKLALWSAMLFLTLVGSVAFAAEYPQVSQLQPFSAEADYMSRPGYLRFLVFQQSGQWMTRHESVAIVKQQTERTSSY